MALALVSLFDQVPGVIFYAKDRDSRFVAANAAMLAAKNLTDPSDFLGLTDRDFHPAPLAEAYLAEDFAVMESGEALPNQVWFVLDASGRPGWFNSSKVPLRNESGQVCGIAGIRYGIETSEEKQIQFQALAPVIQHLEENFAEKISMKQMAKLAGLSSTHFNRRFRKMIGMSPTRFLHSLRIEYARQLLARSDRPVGEISLETGYHDQSHFTRHFRKLAGMTPRMYRSSFRN